jgi:hypothetical protein
MRVRGFALMPMNKETPVKRSLTLLSFLFVALALVAGCGDDTKKPKTIVDKGKTPVTHVHIHACTKCGCLEDKCLCKTKSEKCEKCRMVKGSPGCCDKEFIKLVEDGAHIDICHKCGNIEDGERCCEKDKDAKTCPKCGKHEGSFMCKQTCGVQKSTTDTKDDEATGTKDTRAEKKDSKLPEKNDGKAAEKKNDKAGE